MIDQPHIVSALHDDGTLVVRPTGDFDMSAVDLLRSTFADAIDATTHRVVVDLSETTFLDSMALGSIIGALRRASGWGGWVRLVAPRPNVRKVLRLTELDTVFGLYDTVDQAIAHVDDRQTANH